ncbi:MAG TPA: acetyl-CoA C-acetyltransferase [Gammaproteobacteria bacterium]|nr:acetyl-CoA C-acetyltransferase [Gammaproteobacteria bacterium]
MESLNMLAGRAVYIVDGARTPFLKARGKPGPFHASDLAVAAGRALLSRQPFAAPQLDEVILGCVSSGPDEANIARVVALRLGCGHQVPAWTVQRNCASGMQALDSAAKDIVSGRADLVLAGGAESMSHHPVLLNPLMVDWLAEWNQASSTTARLKQLTKLSGKHLTPVIGLLRGLTDPVVGLSMGQTAENLASRFGVSRRMMDQYASKSHLRLGGAIDNGYLEELVPLYADDGALYQQDDGVRRDSTAEILSKLKPVFDPKFGSVTAGNSAQVTDGAAMLLLASADAVEQHQLPVLARLRDVQWAGLDPAQMGLGPVYAMAPLLQRNALNSSDINYWEINEAFSAQVLACRIAWEDIGFCREELGQEQAFGEIPCDRLNVDGGAVSLGHPVGASGARIVLHLAHVLKRHRAKNGIASLCIGGGQGGAMWITNEEHSQQESDKRGGEEDE